MENKTRTAPARATRWTRPAALLAGPVILALLISLFGGASASQAQAGPVVRCEPVAAAGPVGQPLAVDIYVENVPPDDPADEDDGLYSVDVRLSFDTTVAQIVDADPNSDGTQIEPLNTFLKPDFVVKRDGDNVAGTIWYAATQVAPTPPVFGSGPLARITFQSLKVGSFEMPITYQLLSSKSGDEGGYDATVVDCRVLFYDSALSLYLPVSMDMN